MIATPRVAGLWRRWRTSTDPRVGDSARAADRRDIERSGLFDPAWYRAHAPEAAGHDPLDHYRAIGWRHGRSPGPGFDAAWYLQRYNDVAAAGIDPLLHFIRAGRKEGRAPRAPAPALFDGFQSLGMDCEFGLVQRHFGSEPLGLFRFSTTSLRGLMNVLRRDDDPFGDPAALTVRVEASGEYRTILQPDGIVFHSDVGVALLDPAATRAHERRRLGFLWRKLREDLEEAHTTFVFRSGNRMSARGVGELVRALRRHGDNALLWVTPPDAGRPAGTVEHLAPGLMRGAVERQSAAAGPYAFETWETLCREAASLRRSEDRP
ncbi:MAG: hypothetical protein U1E23_16605 [Reyranellaceae bacterium]